MVKDSMNRKAREKEHRIKEVKIADISEVLENTSWLVTEEEKASRKSGDTDDPVDVILYHPIAIRLTHGFIKMGWSANAVTITSLFVGLAGSVLFYPQNRWLNLLGILIEIFAAILDCCDGQIARLTHTSSQLGRVLDGTVDITNYLAVYIVLGLRMMKENIPFTETPWSFWIWIVIFVAMLCHAGQARIADYYRGLHLYFLNGSSRSNLARSRNLEAELAALPKNCPLYERIYRRFYLVYTKNQEKITPKAQRLLETLEKMDGPAPEGLAAEYVTQSRRYIQTTNMLTYNLRTYALFILLLLALHAFYFPFVIIILEGVRLFMVAKYEGIAEDVYERFLSGRNQAD